MIQLILSPMQKALGKHDVTLDRFAKNISKALDSKITKTAKIKGVLDKDSLAPGVRILATAGADDYAETVIAWEEDNWAAITDARKDGERMFPGVYQADKVELSGEVIERIEITLVKPGNGQVPPHNKALSHNKEICKPE